MNYTAFIGIPYQPPHGCLKLVQVVFRDGYGIALGEHDRGVDPTDLNARSARFQEELAKYCTQVNDPKERDLILLSIGGKPAHIGIVIDPGWMLHSYEGGESVIERYRSVKWNARVNSFWRYNK